MSKYILAGHFILKGSGYASILEHIAVGLTERGHEVMILAVNYRGQPHDFPFHIVPMKNEWLAASLEYLPNEWKADRVIVARDVPDLNAIATWFINKEEKEKLWNLEALFPIESDPIITEWVHALGNYKARYVISKYGTDLCNSYDVPSIYLPIGCNIGSNPKNKSDVRDIIGLPKDKTIFLTISENHDRKCLPLGIEAFSKMKDKDSEYVILTNLVSPAGWNLNYECEKYHVSDRVRLIQKGIDITSLSMLYWSADALIVPSGAEGACMPIYEAAAHGLPVICGTWTGMKDFTDNKYDWIIPTDFEYSYTHPWGNVTRWFIDKDKLCSSMEKIALIRNSKQYIDMKNSALDFASSRKWNDMIDIIERGYQYEKKDQ